MAQEKTDAELLAHKIYEWLSGIKHGDESILHAAVTCDFAGSENFKRSLAKLIGEYLSGTRPMPHQDEVCEYTETPVGNGRTDAELLARFERWWSWEGVGTSPAYGQDQDECNYNLTRTAWLNGAYVAQELSGTRPLPTDEVAELRAEVEDLRERNDRLEDQNDQIQDENARLRDRVAELEALVKVLREGGRPIGDRPFTIAPDGQDHKYWSGTTDLGATFSKPAPGAEGGDE